MKVKEIIYKNLLRLLNNLTTDSVDFALYYSGKDENEAAALIRLNEGITNVILDLKKSRLRRNIFTNFNSLINLVDGYRTRFPDYPNNRIKEIILIATLIKKLDEAIGGDAFDIDKEYILETKFCLELLKKSISHKNFYFSDTSIPSLIENSLVLIDLSDLNILIEFINSTAFSVNLTIILLSKIGLLSTVLVSEQYVLITKKLKNKSSAIYSFVCLHVTAAGYLTHTPNLYNSKPSINPIRKILPKNLYQQFDDSLIIISEYNYHKDVLDKYLRLYHLIENFMYKFPLVNLEKSHAGSIFSIRDFKRMYDDISDSEINTLKKLFKVIFLETNSPNISFQQYILNSWSSFIQQFSTHQIDKLLSLLRVAKTKGNGTFCAGEIKNDNLLTFYSQLVYAYRNSLVHNRETEFHLTHETLRNHPIIGNTAREVLEKFVIPTLEEISFYLIIEKNQLVWYKGSKLTLWTN